MRPEGPCRSCRFWGDGCTLIREGRTGELLDYGACQPWDWVAPWIDRFLRTHRTDVASEREDILQDLQLFLRRRDVRFPADFVPDAQHLRPYLRAVVLNRASDFLRRERLVPKIRCGACLYRGVAGTCTRTHAHYGEAVGPGTNPQTLVPPCKEFFWRYRPITIDEISERKKVAPAREGLADEEVAGLLTLALEELMRAGPAGRRRALILKEHFLAGLTATAIADRHNCNERTVRRNIKAGLVALEKILREQFGVDQADLL
jgi:DNA-directed RNA polymerase specialized sigma24 family protein